MIVGISQSSRHSDVHFLRAVYRSDRPVGVSREGRYFRAKVLKRFHLGSFRSEHDASLAIVAWYREHYGREWKAVLASRHINPFRYVRRPLGGFTVTAFVYGEPVLVSERCGGQLVNYYPTIEMAKRAVARWVVREFGLFAAVAPVFLYRLSDKFRPSER